MIIRRRRSAIWKKRAQTWSRKKVTPSQELTLLVNLPCLVNHGFRLLQSDCFKLKVLQMGEYPYGATLLNLQKPKPAACNPKPVAVSEGFRAHYACTPFKPTSPSQGRIMHGSFSLWLGAAWDLHAAGWFCSCQSRPPSLEIRSSNTKHSRKTLHLFASGAVDLQQLCPVSFQVSSSSGLQKLPECSNSMPGGS